MFARTDRLLLRPGWIEDAPALTAALDHGAMAGAIAALPCPCTLDDARVFLAQPFVATRPRLLIFARDAGAPDLVGGIGLYDRSDRVTLGYWIRPDRRWRGYATEAGRAMLDIAAMLGIERLTAGDRIDNPASAAVLHKLGFRPGRRRRMEYLLHPEPIPQPLAA